MHENALNSPSLYPSPQEVFASFDVAEGPESRRAEFVDQLLSKKLVTDDLVNSGALNTFSVDDTGDSLIHILTGDGNGGAHHLRTLFELGLTSPAIATELSEDRSETYAELR